jgi:phosphohistidine phosphatase
MKTLYLLRHAHSDPSPSPEVDDHDRLLSARGEMESENLGAFMKEHGHVPDALFCSTSLRTRDTVRIAFDVLFPNGKAPVATRFDREFYLADAELILDEVQEADNRFSRLLVVGHNPGFEDLAERLARAGGQVIGKFPPSTMAVFTADVDDWRDFTPKKAVLKTVFMP